MKGYQSYVTLAITKMGKVNDMTNPGYLVILVCESIEIGYHLKGSE